VRTQRIDVAGLLKKPSNNLEETARRVRYQWLAGIAKEYDAGWVATAHTADDQAETMLHHFLRGSGLQGLSGMAERRPLETDVDLVRPLLTIRRAEVMAYLQENHLSYCRDVSNEDLGFTRNRLRHQLMPVLEGDYNPNLVEVLGRTALQLRDIQDELDRQARALLASVELPRAGAMVVLKRAPLQAVSVVLIRELVRLVWQREGWPQGAMGFVDWDRAAALVGGVATGDDFPGGVRMRAVGQVIQLEQRGVISPSQ